MDKTKNYSLNLPAESDIIDVNVLNENFTAIDAQMSVMQTKMESELKTVTMSNSVEVISASGKTSFYHGTTSGFMDDIHRCWKL